MKSENGHVPQFEPLDRRHGVRVTDPIEETQFDLYTAGSVTPVAASTDDAPWCFPVDATARLAVEAVTVPLRVNVNVRRPDGELVASSANRVSTVVDERGPYTVELGSTPIKLFLLADSRVRVSPHEHTTEVAFPDADGIYLGARTLHEQPARTLTTTRNPRDIMQVVSEFGAALKTTSPERSFPTLRGHPPLVEFGDSVEIPHGRRRPDTGITIEVPPEVEYIYPAAPLAYYLGAAVRPGPTPRVVMDHGFDFPFAGPEGVERGMTRALRHIFTMDCLTRVEGYYPVELAERQRVERIPGLDLDYETLYESSLPEQVETYLSLPFEDVASVAPEWRLTADLPADPDYADVLPHLAGELASVRCGGDVEPPSPPEETDEGVCDAIDSFVRTTGGSEIRNEDTEPQCQTAGRTVSQEDVFELESAETATQTYIGDGFPLGANKGSRVSYERQLSLRSNAPTQIGVTVVCNDSEMTEEVGAGEHYGTRDLFEFDVDIRTDLSCEQLRRVFESDTDFVHYIGHVDQRGMQAADGYLDAGTLDAVGVTAFILNGCRTFRQGSALVDAGAIAGIVTLENVHNSLATAVGNNVARLLNTGWPLDGALELFTDETLVGSNYIVVGDGSVEIINADACMPNYAVIRPLDAGEYEVTVHSYPTRSHHLGTLYTPYVGDNATRYLASGELDSFTVSAGQLGEYLSLETIPVLLPEVDTGGELSLRWSDEIDVETL